MTVAVATRQLPSGASIPVIGLGVYESGPGDETYNSVLTALKLGYRHVDTARFYQNETDVYRAIVDSGVPRDEVFVTSKVFSIEAWTYDSVVEATKTSAANLGGYVDLYLLHAPEVAGELNASPAQVLIAWSIAKGFVTLPKSVKQHRLKENLEAHNVKLSGEQIAKLDSPDDYFLSSFLNGRPFDPIKDYAV
ncbi:hypothetical protein Poli38472_008105 [Pythium oligandrum]|uniref:NADP-dependent oxidoreductase domain-containing protein n=1 Tax=Pythium oligandrum TaxID=41045 RepID=A0A8K1CM60_PYTOL|nr:hypothetical protein Poli38472_008105 [Pythium oligandrum]|eukprot:TMW65463.1 hypothetical protein Poli38472_008105 [Pythium oligandrum]